MKMDDSQLNKLLRKLPVPERSAGYWEYFPKRVTARLHESPVPTRRVSLLAWGLGLATVCVAVGLTLSVWLRGHGPEILTAAQRAENRKLFEEIATLFPNRLESIEIDAQGVKLHLSDAENVPVSKPLLVSICKAGQCRRIITFSGQTVQVNGDTLDVLADGKGNVLLVGRTFVWSSAEPTSRAGYRIHAEALGAS